MKYVSISAAKLKFVRLLEVYHENKDDEIPKNTVMKVISENNKSLIIESLDGTRITLPKEFKYELI